MQKSTLIRTAIAGSVAAAGLAVGGIAVSNAAPDAPDRVGLHDGRGGPGGQHRAMLGGAGLADALGVSEQKLRDALENVREEFPRGDRAGERPSAEKRDAMRAEFVKALAEELGIAEDELTEALDELRESHLADRREVLADRLEQAVEDGELTEDDKASVLKAYDAGVLGGPGRR